jgi:hypothetical protein
MDGMTKESSFSDVVQSWWSKPSGSALTDEEAYFQTGAGSLLMVIGGAGIASGHALMGIYVFADGGNLVSGGLSKKKVFPSEMFLNLIVPFVDLNDTVFPNPLP